MTLEHYRHDPPICYNGVVMYDNIEWLKTMFGQSHMQHIPLVESFNCKWCYFKHGQFYYNPKQAAIANPLEFKIHVLASLYQVLL